MAGESKAKRRAIVLVIDGLGVGAAPDADSFGDPATCNTMANVAINTDDLKLPNLASLGLGNICKIPGIDPVASTRGIFGKLEEASNGKDTQTGHWEMMGVINNQAFPVYPDGFPDDVIDEFLRRTGEKGILCNKPISGTQVLAELGEEHQKTGKPIVYTSGDSVFQIACHVDTIPLTRQYELCEAAREMLDGPHRVGRVIARPFTGKPGAYERLSGDRRDYAVPPPEKTFLDSLTASGVGVFGVGKIEDIFVGNGITHAKHTGSNQEGLRITLQAVNGEFPLAETKLRKDFPDDVRLIFTNLVDTDSLYGHRRDVAGYASALREIDEWLGKLISSMKEEDLLLISSDHGNDPTAPGTDHTREFVPLIAYSPSVRQQANNLGTRKSFCDIAATLSDWLGMTWSGPGKSILSHTAQPAV